MEDAMDRVEKLFKKYQDYIEIGEKPINEQVDFLRNKGELVDMPLTEIAPSILGCMIFNINPTPYEVNLNSIGRAVLDGTDYTDLKFAAYKFLRSECNKNFYERYEPLDGENIIYVIFEVTSGYFECTCEKLKLEFMIHKGISQYDYDHKTQTFFHYLSRIEALEDEWYLPPSKRTKRKKGRID